MALKGFEKGIVIFWMLCYTMESKRVFPWKQDAYKKPEPENEGGFEGWKHTSRNLSSL